MFNKRVQRRTERRIARVRSALNTTIAPLVRVSVFRSLNHIYVQAIDDAQQKTLAACSSQEVKKTGDKKAHAKAVGIAFAQKALAAGVTKVCFDRGRYLYHGRVQALADGIREGGVQL